MRLVQFWLVAVTVFQFRLGLSEFTLRVEDLANASTAVSIAAEQLGVPQRIAELFGQTETKECRLLIAQHLYNFTSALNEERGLPFSDWPLKGSCPEPVYDWDNLPPDIEHVGIIQNRTYQPPRNESVYIDDPGQLKLLYAILTHERADSTIRLVERLYEPGHSFVIHVDGKSASDETYEALVRYAMKKPHVHVIATRLRINWGGFSMVRALLELLQYALNMKDYYSRQRDPIDFHKVVHLSSTSYPIASKEAIRRRLSDFPLDANFLQIVMKPTRPGSPVWNYFVECDDRLHRIYRLPPLTNQTHGVELFTSSQWFIISREFASYIAEAKAGTFVQQYLEYSQHVVVADETFLGTVLRNTEFCTTHHNRNFLHLQFDRWESDLPQSHRDARKCPMKDPNHCGRSPTTMSLDYTDILELSDDLFARKFSDEPDSRANVKDMVDGWVDAREERFQKQLSEEGSEPSSFSGQPSMKFEGHGVLIVAKESLNTGNASDVPLCLGLGETGNNLRLVECFHRIVVPTLAENWYTGAVIKEETLPHNRWDLDPCTSDGKMERDDETGEIHTTAGKYSNTGPRCMLKMMDGIRAGRCFDGDSGTNQPGGEVQVFPCIHRWVQFLSVGSGEFDVPAGSLFFTIPAHIVRQIEQSGHDQIPYMCLGVWGRGVADEVDWDDPMANDPDPPEPEEWAPLSNFVNDELFSTQCTNKGAVVEWLFVPFIVENSTNSTETEQPKEPAESTDLDEL